MYVKNNALYSYLEKLRADDSLHSSSDDTLEYLYVYLKMLKSLDTDTIKLYLGMLSGDVDPDSLGDDTLKLFHKLLCAENDYTKAKNDELARQVAAKKGEIAVKRWQLGQLEDEGRQQGGEGMAQTVT